MNIRTMTVGDIPFGLRLSAQNRWNQVEADWRRQLDLEPAGCFLAERGGVPIGTACCCVFGAVAWINLVLVEREQRGQGVGTALMRHVLRYLDERGVASIRLDATALGQPVYAKLGFVADFALTRFEGALTRATFDGHNVEPATLADLPSICRLDEEITRTPREELLRGLLEPTARKFVTDGNLQGYCLMRPGANAWQVGPMQGTSQAAEALFGDLALRFAGQNVYLDMPIDNVPASAFAASLGLTAQRSFLRMTRGRSMCEDIERYWCSFGPEKG